MQNDEPNASAGQPVFSAQEIGDYIQENYDLQGSLVALPAELDQNYRLDTVDSAKKYVIKISHKDRARQELDFENQVMSLLSENWSRSACPQVVPAVSGQTINKIQDTSGATYHLRLLTYLRGVSLAEIRPYEHETLRRIGRALGEVDRCLIDFQHPAMVRQSRWDLQQVEWISAYTQEIPDPTKRGTVDRLLLQYRARCKPILPKLPKSVIHNDANDENLLLEPNPDGGWQVSGLLDFGDTVYTHTVNELAIACAYMIFGAPSILEAISNVAAGYHQARPLSDPEMRVLFPLICMRLCTSVCASAIAARTDPDNAHRQISDQYAWQTLVKLERIDWRLAENKLRRACGKQARPIPVEESTLWRYESLLEARRHSLGFNLSLTYEAPLEIVRGRGQYLYEPGGRAYLDCVNNVCHVGHSHPKVVAAIAKQAAILNTNTRYLHTNIIELARRLTDTLPEPLRVCFFVNSGSEANELAVRLARAYTGRRDVIVLDGAYHGNTSTLVDLSPYKSEGPGGQGLPDWAHKAIKPDPYQGPYRGKDRSIGDAYASHIQEICQNLVAQDRPPALFLAESIMGCGGQIVLPDGYLKAAFDHVRAVGGVCITDEVQVGMGRVGTHWWAFETQGVVPDIITIGKPIGNGHPLGAVVTTPEIARAFDNGMEFFNTFGGNPVSCAVGLAVLDVIEAEGLRQRAERVGRYLQDGFIALGEHFPQIGDVRGLGLFMGVELVSDPIQQTPATELTAQVIEYLKSNGILLSSEGPHENVFKIKPPLQFDETDADIFLSAVARALHKLT